MSEKAICPYNVGRKHWILIVSVLSILPFFWLKKKIFHNIRQFMMHILTLQLYGNELNMRNKFYLNLLCFSSVQTTTLVPVIQI